MDDGRDWEYGYDGAVPPLPKEIRRYAQVRKDGQSWIERLTEEVPQGCYFIWVEPRLEAEGFVTPNLLAGVLRIHHREGELEEKGETLFTRGSGDLYQVNRERMDNKIGSLLGQELPKYPSSILQFPISNYRYYLRLEALWITKKDVLLEFETHRYDDQRRIWQRRQTLTLRHTGKLRRLETGLTKEDFANTPHGILNDHETEIAKCGIVYLSQKLRHADVRLHAIATVSCPKERKVWEDALASADWSVDVQVADPIEQPKLEHDGWTIDKLRELTTKFAGGDAKSWDYHLFVVDRVRMADSDEGPLGIMFEGGRGDFARLAAAVGALELIVQEPKKCLQDNRDHFYWAALHELGHMLGLFHNPDAVGIMRSQYEPGKKLDYDLGDQERLRHLPDLWVRPRGVPFAHRYRSVAIDLPDLLEPTRGLELSIEPPILAVGKRLQQLELRMLNSTGKDLVCPHVASAQPHHGFLGVLAVTPFGEWAEICPISLPRRLKSSQQTVLNQGREQKYSLYWKRRSAAAPFRQAGLYELHVYLTWRMGGIEPAQDTVFHARAKCDLHVVVPAAMPLPEKRADPQPKTFPGIVVEKARTLQTKGIDRYIIRVTNSLQSILQTEKWFTEKETGWAAIGFEVLDDGEVSYAPGHTNCPTGKP